MDEEEHKVYGGEIPDMDPHDADVDVDMSVADDDAIYKELDEMNKRLKEMEEEAAALREMQAKVEKEMGFVQDPATANQAGREEADSRSVFVDNVEEVQQHFQSCGAVNGVTILTDKFGQPMWNSLRLMLFKRLYFLMNLNFTSQVLPKRTNVPGMKQYRPRRFSPYMVFRPRRPYVPPYFFSPYGYGKVPRYSRPMPYMPYY